MIGKVMAKKSELLELPIFLPLPNPLQDNAYTKDKCTNSPSYMLQLICCLFY
jgi:hypothetical protein